MATQKNSQEKVKETSLSKWNKITSGWKPYIEAPLPLEDLDEIMVGASIPAFSYYLMLLLSAIIATLGLLSNSAPAIIGAMIIAPLMAPIISLAYSIDIFDWKLARRSFITIVTGVLLVVFFSYLSTTFYRIKNCQFGDFKSYIANLARSWYSYGCWSRSSFFIY